MTSPLQVGYFIHGRGRGHASRSLPVVQKLRGDGHLVTVHAGGDASDILKELPPWRPRSPLNPGRTAIARLPWRVARDVIELRRDRPDLVVSDGDQSVIAAARLRRTRTVALGHDLVFSSCALPQSVNRTALRFQRVNGAIPTHLAEHRVAVHFLPVEASRDNTWVARPDGDDTAPTTNEGHYVAYFRDSNGANIVAWLRAQGREVRWFGPGATTEDGTASAFADRERFQRDLRGAAGVIGTAGSNLLAECVLHGKPMLALYQQQDTEQELNANLAAAAHVAMSSAIDSVDAELVERFALRVAAGEFARIPLAEHLRPVSEVVSKLVDEMAS